MADTHWKLSDLINKIFLKDNSMRPKVSDSKGPTITSKDLVQPNQSQTWVTIEHKTAQVGLEFKDALLSFEPQIF